jgi:membrane protein implicated in regulation of membrane protease activity
MPDLQTLYLTHPFWVWIALAGALLAVEVATGSGWMLWPSGSAAVVGVLVVYAGLSPGQAVLVFALLTISSALLARRYLPKSLFHHAAGGVNDNIGRLVGQEARVVTPFKERCGRVFVDGKEWAAELDEGESLEAGARVQVTGVAGAHLRVRGA